MAISSERNPFASTFHVLLIEPYDEAAGKVGGYVAFAANRRCVAERAG
jgi:hypothetical protein